MATLIYNVTDLQNMKNDLAADYELANDIDACATLTWNGGLGFEPVGWNQAPGFAKFTGSFDGKGFTISNLYINRPTTTCSGLFGRVEGAGSVENVHLTNADITGNYLIGALVAVTYVDVKNCSSTGSVTGGAGGGGVGGLLGYAYGNVDECWSSCTVISTTLDWAIGGLIGYAGLAAGEAVRLCYATGDVSAPDAEEVGGLIGDGGADVINSYARGDVTGDQYVGGLVGTNSKTIDKCHSTGLVTGNSDEGGLCGLNTGTITNSFWDTQTSGQAASSGGIGKTAAEMKVMATFTSWNFATIWAIVTACNNGYPCLLTVTPFCVISPIPDVPDSPRRTVDVEDITPLEAIRNIEMAARGRFYTDEEGKAVYKSRYGRNPL